MTNDSIHIQPFFDDVTNTVTYVVQDIGTREVVIIDPVLNYDPHSGKLSSEHADDVIAYLDRNDFSLTWILETHAHADHVSAASYIKQKRGGKIAIGEHITTVQRTFAELFNIGQDLDCSGAVFDVLLKDAQRISFGNTSLTVMHTPGHTPACVSYLIADAAFVGDTIFMPDFGTARADFPQGDAATLFQSIQKILALPKQTRIFVGHDYKSDTRHEYAWESSVLDERLHNIHVKQGTQQSDFVMMRNKRDANLPVPRLLLPSIQLNIRAGQLPEPEANGKSYLKIPLSDECYL